MQTCYFGHAWLHEPKVKLSTCRKLSCLSSGKKVGFIPYVFLEVMQKYAYFLFWVLWACLATHTQNDSINLYKTSMFFCMPKINFIIHFFFEVLHFKESCSFIGQQHFGPLLENREFARYGIGCEISRTILVFILDCLHEILMTKLFKNPKNLILGAILGPFLPKLRAKINFPERRGSVRFLNVNGIENRNKVNVNKKRVNINKRVALLESGNHN